MSLSKAVVGRPTTVLIIFVLIAGFGLYSSSDLAIDLFPEIDPPVLILFTNYEGAGPEEIEKSVTRPLEGQLSNVSNIERISSTSSEGSSQIQLEFTYGTDMNEATNEVRDRLELVKDFLPDDASSPQIFKFDPSLIPILQLEVSGNRTPEELRQLAENTIQPRVEQIEGVALASVQGGRERVIRVEIPQNRLEAYDLNFSQIAAALRANNVQLSAGNIEEGSRSYLVRTAGEFSSIEEVRNTVITYRGRSGTAAAPGGNSAAAAVRLRDIANVYDGYRDETNAVYINGEPGVFVIVQKQSGTNSVQVADNVINRIPRINEALPAGVELSVVQDTTTLIRDSLADVSSSAITGGVLAVLILFFFLRSFRTTLIIAVSIPVSIIVTLMLMYFTGLTLNLMTLTGLALGVGMLVDNSIVILENIFRYREKGAKLTASAILGSQEMITAITASTLTTVMVFLPLALFRAQLEVIGELFSDLAFTVVISLLSSLAVAVFLIPVLTSRYVPISSRKQRPLRGVLRWIDDGMAAMFTGLDNAYMRSLAFSLRHKFLVILVVLAAFVGSLFMIPMTGFEFTPDQEEDSVELDLEMPIGTRLDVTRSVLRQMEAIVEEEVSTYRDVIIQVGEPAFFGFLGAADTSKGSLTVILPRYEEREESAGEVQEILRAHFDNFPGAVFSFGGGGGGGGGFNAAPVEITLRSEDRELMRRTGEEILDLIEAEVPGATEPQMNLAEGLPEVEIVIDRQKAYELGLNINTIGQEVRANVDGITAGQFREGGNEFDILLLLEEGGRDQIPDLQRIFVNNQFGQQIPLSSIASIRRTSGPVNITREDQSRTLTITAGLARGETINVVMPEIQRLITEGIPATDELVITYGGDFEDLQEYGQTFIYVILIAVFLVFGVMASQFESFLDPFIILFTVPLTLIGVILLYVGTGTNFSLFTAVGLVVLVGIVVNNGIVLVDYTNLLRKRGNSIADACVAAGGNRLRPILMTTLTTVLGLLPVAFAAGEGSTLVQPIAKTVVGGLTVATLLTLYLVPVIYAIFNGLSERRLNRKRRRREARLARQVREAQRDENPTPSGETPATETDGNDTTPAADAPEKGDGPEDGHGDGREGDNG
ncbi:MAG: efflux RND transporter permease subunit [Alkalispirochaeta sp.]